MNRQSPTLAFLTLAFFYGCGASGEATEPTPEQPTTQPAAEAPPAEPVAEADEAPSTDAVYTCNQVETNHICYTVRPPAALLPGHEGGCSGAWTEGEHCPSENVVATCRKPTFDEVRRFYEGVSLENAETACTTFGGTFAAEES